MIRIKRAYDKIAKEDGCRILIDGMWPKGISKKDGGIDLWLRQLAPTPPLRKWFDHDPKKFPEFTKRYKNELKDRNSKKMLLRIKDIEKEKTVTLLYGAKDRMYNNAVVILEVLGQIG